LNIFRELNVVVNFSKERITYADSFQLMKDSDVLLLIDFLGDFSPIMLGKLGDYFFFNKPIIALAPENSETSRLMGSGYELSSSVDDEEKIYEILQLIYKAWKESDLKRFDLSKQKKYVSVQNTIEIFQKSIIDEL
jgi:hypothetical protein